MRPVRDFRPQQLYGVTQRGNQGQWVYRDDQDFRKALDLIAPLGHAIKLLRPKITNGPHRDLQKQKSSYL